MRFRICAVMIALFSLTGSVFAQQTTGGIQGVVRDDTGLGLAGVSITITDSAKNRSIEAITNEIGLYVVRSLPAARYEVRATLQEFKTKVITLVVEVGTMATGDIVLGLGDISQVVIVRGDVISVNTTEHSVAGTITSREIQNIPLNGRNFLDLAQTEPGVQLVDAGTFDPTKNQFTGVALAGRNGRVTRISIDGIDISDEVVGTTTQNISVDAVQEFQVSQSSFDPSTSLASSGAVNIITRSGSNQFHGSAFLFYRDEEVAALPTSRTGSPEAVSSVEGAEFDREQAGFSFGGPIKKDKLFFFSNYEKVNQDGTAFVSIPNFPVFNTSVSTPFNDNLGIGRLDWNATDSTRLFFRYSHETNDGATGFGGVTIAPFINQNVSNAASAGLDTATSSLTHSFRYGHASFDNEISANSLGLPVFTGAGVGVSVSINEGTEFLSGPNFIAPQATYVTDQQWKYDGAWVVGNHTLRYGSEINWTKASILFPIWGEGPEAHLLLDDNIRQNIIARGGNPQDPLEYPVLFAILGNGNGALTEISSNGRGSGFNNTRLAWYAADSWRISPTLNLNLGVRYEVDTGQVHDDLPLPDELAGVLGAQGVRATRLDKNNFAPQVGFAWQPVHDGRTVIRGGAGIFYETNLITNSLFDRTDRLPAGLGLNFVAPPLSGVDAQGRVTVGGQPVNDINSGGWPSQPLRNVIDQIGQTHLDFQAASARQELNPEDPPRILVNREPLDALLAQDYQTPYAIHMNIGVQQQLASEWVLSVDYVRNRSLHHNLVRDFNRRFAANTLNPASAQALISDTLAFSGVGSIDEAIAAGLTISDIGLSNACAGLDPSFGSVRTIMTSGISTYNALQIRTTGRFERPVPGVKNLFANLSYSLSRYEGVSLDQDFHAAVNKDFAGTFNDDYFNERNIGPTGLDRTHQLSAQFFFDLPGSFQLNWSHRWATALPQNLLVAGGPRRRGHLLH